MAEGNEHLLAPPDTAAQVPVVESAPAQLYDDIAFDYAAIKTNPFKSKCEEPTFWRALGDVAGLSVLDLACGSGYYSRQMRMRGARWVRGVDISPEMIAMAEAEEQETPLGGLSYVTSGVTQSFEVEEAVDVVTAQFLLPYAQERAVLVQMCCVAYTALRPGGRFVSISSSWFDGAQAESQALGYSLVGPSHPLEFSEGMQLQLTLFGEGRSTRVTFPNSIWSKTAIEAALTEAGFVDLEFYDLVVSDADAAWAHSEDVAQDLPRSPIVFFSASKPN